MNQKSKYSVKSNAVIFAVSLVLSLVSVSVAFAYDEDDDMAGNEPVLDKAQLRMYAGGRDEQDLIIQEALPQPSRSIDGVASSGESGADSAAPVAGQGPVD